MDAILGSWRMFVPSTWIPGGVYGTDVQSMPVTLFLVPGGYKQENQYRLT